MANLFDWQEKSTLLPKASRNAKYMLAIHGGAFASFKEAVFQTPGREDEYKAALSKALLAGYAVLQDGGEAMDAAVAAVMVMENNPLFNSGKGAVFNAEGKNELETSIMLSKPPASHPHIPATRKGLGLTLLTHARNPASLARALYLAPDAAPHTMLSGRTPETLGAALGETLVDPSYFFTEGRWREHRRGLGLPEEPFPPGHAPSGEPITYLDEMPTGTVGAVALDARGCIVAVTSTGGRTNKLAGRVGDTPQMGSGFWAEEWAAEGWMQRAWDRVRGRKSARAVGVSCTGDGDYFIRQNTASTIARRMQYMREPVDSAGAWVVEDLRKAGGPGGLIAIDDRGHVTLPYNCAGMFRGVIKEDGVPKTAIFEEDVSAWSQP